MRLRIGLPKEEDFQEINFRRVNLNSNSLFKKLYFHKNLLAYDKFNLKDFRRFRNRKLNIGMCRYEIITIKSFSRAGLVFRNVQHIQNDIVSAGIIT